MGQQTNKVQKRRRRLAYVERLKVKAKEASVMRTPKKKAAAKKAPAEKKAAAPAAVAETAAE